MGKRIFSLFFLLFVANIAWANNQDALDLVDLLKKITAISADFRHYSYDTQGKLLEETQGQMALRKKRQFRWQVTKPDRAVVISDGEKLWNYDEDLEQVTIQSWSAQEKNSPAAFLTGEIDKLEDDYEVSKVTGACLRDSAVCFEMKAKKADNNFQHMWIGFNQDLIHEFHFDDPLGQKNVFVFSNVRNNVKLPHDTFVFEVPQGVDVIESL